MLENQEHSRLIKKAILFIESDYMYILGVNDVSDALGVSKEHFIREFKKNIGEPPNKFIVKYKIEKAKELMILENLEIASAAEAVGFSCGNYFSKVFKKYEGMTPTEFIKSTPVINPSKTNGNLYM